MLIDVPVGKTSLERQSAALFLAPEIHSNVILYVAQFQTPSVYFVIGVLAITGIMLEVYDHFGQLYQLLAGNNSIL